MSTLDVGGLTRTFTASGDLSGQQYRFVRLSASDTVAAFSSRGQRPAGVLLNDPTDGQAALVQIMGVCEIESDEALAAGVTITPSADGQATLLDTTGDYAAGLTYTSSSASPSRVVAAIDCVTPWISA